MVVQHNLTAMNSNRMLGLTTASQAKSTEKLSSGYKINRAADDAAGLSISEKMRKQIRGLTKASSNAEDGISAVQTAEGALQEVTDMLQRMNELAVQASNGTNSTTDRQSIQDEIDQLTTEIDRVAETTKFNETYLLKGNADGTSSSQLVNAHDAGLAGKLVDNGKTAKFTVDSKLNEGDKVTIAGAEYTIGTDAAGKSGTDGYKKIPAAADITKVSAGDSITQKSTGISYTVVDKATVNDLTGTDYEITAGKSTFTVTHADGSTSVYDAINNADDAKNVIAKELAAGSTQLKEGDSVTINGNTTTFLANTPATASDFADIISKLDDGAKVQIGRNDGNNTKTAVEYTVGSKTDVVNKVYTVADLANLIQDGDDVNIATNAKDYDAINEAGAKGITISTNGTVDVANKYTAVGNVKSENSDVISKADALQKIAEELQKASSIGTDTAATVKNNNDGTFDINKGSVEVKDKLNFSLHVGADADMTNKITVNLESMSAAGLGIKGINVNDETGMSATYAVDSIEDAIKKVSSQRSALGAVQNRLEHTIDNLDNISENTSSAESRIRDTDMAEEMVEYSKNNIRAQAGQSMLSQANQQTQGVLSLLQ